MIKNNLDETTEEETIDEYFIEDEIPEEFKEEFRELEKETPPLLTSKFVKGKKYYDEKYTVGLIHEWQKSAYIIDGVVMQRDVVVEAKICKEIDKIALAIINQYRYHIFEPVEDLMQESLKECWRNLPKFSTDKGTSFNYFSLICKRHLLNYTTRRSKHRNLNDVDDSVDLESRTEINYDLFFDDLETTLFRLINENYLRAKRKKYLVIASVMLDYLRKTRKYVSKTDMYSWCRSWGLKTSEVREFITEFSHFKEDIFTVSR